MNSDRITIAGLEVFYRVGVPDEERRHSQRLLLYIELFRDLGPAGATDSIHDTTNYFEVSQRLMQFGEGREWKLIESCAEAMSSMLLRDFMIERVTVEIRKFIIPEAQYVSVRLERGRSVS